jgi:hypothetical protein
MNIPKVTAAQAADFAKHWKTPGGVSIFTDNIHHQFTADFANVVLKSFVEDAQRVAAKAAAEAAKPKIVLAQG